MRETSLGNTRALVNAALLAAVYAALTYVTKPISFGAVQFRVSEALCMALSFIVGIPNGRSLWAASSQTSCPAQRRSM